MSEGWGDAAKAFGDPGSGGPPRIPRALVVVVAAVLGVAAVAAAVLVLAGGSGSRAEEAQVATALAEPDCIALWNDERAASSHQVAAAFRGVGDAEVVVRRRDGQCEVTISSDLAGQALRFTQDDQGILGPYGPPEVLGEPASGDPDARIREDGTLAER